MTRNAVPLAAVLVAGAAIAGVVGLESRADAGRHAQMLLSQTANTLSDLQGIPFLAAPGDPSARTVAARIHAAKQRIFRSVVSLERNRPGERGALVAPLKANFAALDRIFVWAAGGHIPAAGAMLLGDAERKTFATAAWHLRERGRDYAAAARRSELESMVGSTTVILLLLGAFGFFYRRSAKISRDQRRAYAELESAQLDRQRLLARTVESAEDERTRIAGDLHDGPIQRLTAAAFSLDLLGLKLDRGEPDVGMLVQDIREQLTGEMASLRQLMFELRPPLLDAGDVSAAIRDCAARLLGPETSCVVRDTTDNARLTPELETVVYRVAREAIVNIQKHAGAGHVDVTLEQDGDRLRLSVVDDGSGFDPDALAPRFEHHLGLVAMRERVESVGGEWRISSVRGVGTRIEAILPWLPPPEDEPVGKERYAVAA